jgi:hypothetical protein
LTREFVNWKTDLGEIQNAKHKHKEVESLKEHLINMKARMSIPVILLIGF